jgi:hypothetical protein
VTSFCRRFSPNVAANRKDFVVLLSHETNSGKVPCIRLQSLPSTSFPIHYSLITDWIVGVSSFPEASGARISDTNTTHKQFKMADVIHVRSRDWWLNSLLPQRLAPQEFTGAWTVCMGSKSLMWEQWETGSGILRVVKEIGKEPRSGRLRERYLKQLRAVKANFKHTATTHP